MRADVARIAAACERLEAGRPEEVPLLVELRARGGCLTSESLLRCAQGLLAERTGESAEARHYFERVFELGVPLPVLLRESARFFKRAGIYERAFRCYALLQAVAPDGLAELLDGAPPPVRARHAKAELDRILDRAGASHWFLPPVKHALAARLGPPDGALAFSQMVEPGGDWGIASARLTGLREFAERHAIVYEDLIPSISVDFPALPIVGGDAASTEAHTRSVFFCALPDCIVSAKSNLTLCGDRALIDAEPAELERVPIEIEVDPTVFWSDGEELTLLVGRGASEREPLERGLSLVGVNSYNFGHWLMEFLPKVLLCREREGFEGVPLIVDKLMPAQNREALAIFAGEDHPVVELDFGEAITVRELWLPAMITYFELSPQEGFRLGADDKSLDADAFRRLVDEIESALASVDRPGSPKRIYLTRREGQHRKLVNRSQVEDWFAAQGFEFLDFEGLSFREQLAYVRGAEAIAGPYGAQMMISLYAGPGKRLAVLSHPEIDTHWANGLIQPKLGQRLLILSGKIVDERPDHIDFSNYEVDVSALPEFLERLLA